MTSWFSLGTPAAAEPPAEPARPGRRRNHPELHVDRDDAHAGWSTGVERVPRVGDAVYCAAGVGEVRALLGKTGDGSRLLEIRLEDPAAKPFFAAASNVLVAPE